MTALCRQLGIKSQMCLYGSRLTTDLATITYAAVEDSFICELEDTLDLSAHEVHHTHLARATAL
jgi:hypothetical protein